MKYLISYEQPQNHFIDFELKVNVDHRNIIDLQLPAWRPGRYELANFAKNIKDFRVFDGDNNPLIFEKINKDSWRVNCAKVEYIIVNYSYYAAELNAGSTYLNFDQLYINPVNCMMYVVGEDDLDFEIDFQLPKGFKIYSSLKKKNNHCLSATNFDQLADSPIIASSSIQNKKMVIDGVDFHFCFQGEIKIDWKRVEIDFKKFSSYQINKFGGFPHNEFYFLFQITPYKSYHGVEHHKSTVILLGSSYDVFSKLYNEFLGISSHELYHVWNVKSIRPLDMKPYDFSKENYTNLGYVTEGVTTYMGDRILYESGVFSLKDYFKELETLLSRHYHNDGRNHYSVSESSWDTWLDGYVAGSPGRKVSIYVEGALIAMICDAKIRMHTNSEKSLHDVMKGLYSGSDQETAYDKSDYKNMLEKVSGSDFNEIFDNLIYNTTDFTKYLKKAFNVFGWEYENIPSENLSFRNGFKVSVQAGKLVVLSVLEKSSGYYSGLAPGDKLISINGYSINNDLNSWLNYFKNESVILSVERDSIITAIELEKINDNQYFTYKVKEIDERI